MAPGCRQQGGLRGLAYRLRSASTRGPCPRRLVGLLDDLRGHAGHHGTGRHVLHAYGTGGHRGALAHANMRMMLGWAARRSTLAALMLQPVRPGMLDDAGDVHRAGRVNEALVDVLLVGLVAVRRDDERGVGVQLLVREALARLRGRAVGARTGDGRHVPGHVLHD